MAGEVYSIAEENRGIFARFLLGNKPANVTMGKIDGRDVKSFSVTQHTALIGSIMDIVGSILAIPLKIVTLGLVDRFRWMERFTYEKVYFENKDGEVEYRRLNLHSLNAKIEEVAKQTGLTPGRIRGRLVELSDNARDKEKTEKKGGGDQSDDLEVGEKVGGKSSEPIKDEGKAKGDQKEQPAPPPPQASEVSEQGKDADDGKEAADEAA